MLGSIVLAILVAHPFSALPLAAQASTTQQPTAPGGQAAGEQPWPPPGVTRPGPGVTSPRLIKGPKPNYTADAMRAKIQGRVVLEAVVLPDGKVGEVRVTRSLDKDFGLDAESVKTLKKWQYQPGTKDGVAVPVLVEVDMTFSLR